MTHKDKVRELLDRLPEESPMDEILYYVFVLEQIDRGFMSSGALSTLPPARAAKNRRSGWVIGAEA